MKISYEKWVEILNAKLVEYNQQTRVVEIGQYYLILDNGVILRDKDFIKFKKRIMNKVTTCWVCNIDNLLTGKINESVIKSELASAGGKKCQQLHGDKIKKALSNQIPWNKGLKGLPGKPHTAKTREKIGLKNSGKGNGMYGHKMSAAEKKHRSDTMRKLILEGKFTPNSNNRNTHWESFYRGKSYRSSWEALYQYYDNTAVYEECRISYEFEGKQRIYIVDFVNHESKLLIEVKPRELCNDAKFIAKMKALESWANKTNYTILIADQNWFFDNVNITDYSQFDELTTTKLKKFYETIKKKRNRQTK